tara:strand:- start:275 stop:382 length:108 start_codon:yes stop_codon:yes gene_type:complete
MLLMRNHFKKAIRIFMLSESKKYLQRDAKNKRKKI